MTALLLVLNWLLLTRMVYLRSDAALGVLPNIALGAVQLLGIGVLLAPNQAALLAAGLIALIAGLNLTVEALTTDLSRGWRGLFLALLLIGLNLIHSIGGPLVPSALMLWLSEQGPTLLPLFNFSGNPGTDLNLLLFGMLLLANETNILIRAVFHHLQLDPTDDAKPRTPDRYAVTVSPMEYQAGRAIGVLERWLMVLVVITTSDLTAVGFIIAVKGLVRLKRLEQDNRDRFAEYLLVGTLLSTLFALVVGQWLLHLADAI